MSEAALALAWPWPALLLSVLLTVAHTAEEGAGPGGPLWAYFGRITGFRLDPVEGVLLFSIALPAATVIVAWHGYTGSAFALGLLAGARLGDTAFSHALPWLQGHRPNPGLYSALAGYLAEGLLLAGFASVSWWGVALGAGFFAAVLPVLRLLARLEGIGW